MQEKVNEAIHTLTAIEGIVTATVLSPTRKLQIIKQMMEKV